MSLMWSTVAKSQSAVCFVHRFYQMIESMLCQISLSELLAVKSLLTATPATRERWVTFNVSLLFSLYFFTYLFIYLFISPFIPSFLSSFLLSFLSSFFPFCFESQPTMVCVLCRFIGNAMPMSMNMFLNVFVSLLWCVYLSCVEQAKPSSVQY